MRILLDDARPRLGRGLGPHAAHARLHQPHAAARSAREVAARAGSRCCCRATSRSSTRSTAGCSTTCARASPATRRACARMSLIEEGAERKVRMANLAIVGSHSTNGVAAIHSELLRTTTVRDFAEMFPERFSNKTNGVTPRRWLLLANPPLAAHDHRRHRRRLDDRPRPAAPARCRSPTTPAFRDAFRQAKREAKARFADWLATTSGQRVDPDTIFDCQVKRIHEYKRQLLNALRIIVLYNRLRANPGLDDAAADVLLRRQGGARLPPRQADHQVHQQPRRRRSTAIPAVRGRLKVVFLPEYCVSLAERLIPASDVSEPDLDRRLRGERHEQHEVHDERRADDRHARRRDDRDGARRPARRTSSSSA